MDLPKVVSDLVQAQAQFNSEAFANCFSETAVVFDEGKTHKGKMEIQQWNAHTNSKYQTVLRPVAYVEKGGKSILTTNVSGTFDGSPIVVDYQFEIKNGLIQSLKIAG